MKGAPSIDASGPWWRLACMCALAAVLAACGTRAEQLEPITCGALFYIEGDAGVPLRIGALADATIAMAIDSSAASMVDGEVNSVADGNADSAEPTSVDAGAAPSDQGLG